MKFLLKSFGWGMLFCGSFCSAVEQKTEDILTQKIKIRPPEEVVKNLKKDRLSWTVRFPFLGDVELRVVSEPSKRLEVKVPGSDKKIVAGPLIIDDGLLTYAQDVFTYTGQGTLFGYKARFGLQELVIDQPDPAGPLVVNRCVMGIVFDKDKKIGLEIIPGLVSSFDSALLVFDNSSVKSHEACAQLGFQELPCKNPLKVLIQTTQFGQPVDVELALCKDGAQAFTKINNIPLTKLYPFLVGTPLETITLNLNFGFDNIFATSAEDEKRYEAGYGWYIEKGKERPFTARLCGSANCSAVPFLKDIPFAQELYCQGAITKEGASLEIGLKTIQLSPFGQISSARLIIETDHAFAKTKAILVGSAQVDLKDLGKVPVTVAATITKEGLLIAGKLVQPLVAQFGNFSCSLQDAKILATSAQEFALMGRVALQKPFFFDGRALVYTQITDDNQRAVLADFSLAKTMKFSSIFPDIAKTPELQKVLDAFVMQKARIVATTKAFKDSSIKQTLLPGINVYAKTDINGVKELDNVRKLLFSHDKKLPAVTLFAALALPDPSASHFKLEIPSLVQMPSPLGDVFSLDSLVIDISGPLLKVGAGGRIGFRPIQILPNGQISFQKEWIYALGLFSLGVDQALFEGSAVGTWKSFFGLEGLSVSDLGFKVAFPYENFPIPSMFAATGITQIAQKKFKGVINFAPNRPYEMALSASLKNECKEQDRSLCSDQDIRFCTDDLVEMASVFSQGKFGGPKMFSAITDGLPRFCIYDSELTIVPTKFKIGDLTFTRGVRIEGGVALYPPVKDQNEKPLFKGRGMFGVDESGFAAQGYLASITIGDLLLTGKGPDNTYGTQDDGPYFTLKCNQAEQNMYATGLLKLGELLHKETELKLSRTELSFKFADKLQGIFDSNIAGSASLLNLDVRLQIDITAGVNTYFKGKIDTVLGSIRSQLQDLNKKVVELESQIAQREQRIIQLEKMQQQKTDAISLALSSVHKALEEELKRIDEKAYYAQQDLTRAIHDIDTKWKELDALRQERDKARQEYNQADLGQKLNPAVWGKVAGLEIAVTSAETALKIARDFLNDIVRRLADAFFVLGKDVLKGTTEASKLVKNILTNPQNIQQNFELVQLASELTGLRIARSGITMVKDVPTVVIDLAKSANTSLADVFKIEKVYYDGSLSNVAKGVFPRLALDMTVLGKKKSFDIQFDIHNPESSSKAIEKVVSEFFSL